MPRKQWQTNMTPQSRLGRANESFAEYAGINNEENLP